MMHPGSTIYVGFGGFDPDVDLPETFEAIFEDEKVLNSDGEIVDWEEDGSDKKYFRKIRDDWSCYGFVIGDYGTADTLDPAELHQHAEMWLGFARQIGQRYGITMEAKVHILSYMA